MVRKAAYRAEACLHLQAEAKDRGRQVMRMILALLIVVACAGCAEVKRERSPEYLVSRGKDCLCGGKTMVDMWNNHMCLKCGLAWSPEREVEKW